MKVRIEPEYERQLERLAASTGRSVDEVLNDFVGAGLARLPRIGDAATARSQRRAIKKLQKELDAVPVENPDDGFDGSQHDRVIYRRDWQ